MNIKDFNGIVKTIHLDGEQIAPLLAILNNAIKIHKTFTEFPVAEIYSLPAKENLVILAAATIVRDEILQQLGVKIVS